jgi:hypothetical protein
MEIIKKIISAIGKFLKWGFASQVTIVAFGTVSVLKGHKLFGLIVIAWAILLTVNDYFQNKKV